MKTKGKANDLDKTIGLRIREARVTLKMSQEDLAEMIGITFQQVQKYENGSNRVSASRLADISMAMNVPIETFYSKDSIASGNALAVVAKQIAKDIEKAAQALERVQQFIKRVEAV